MHKTQERILSLLQLRGVLPLKYAQIAREIHEKTNLQNIKYHLSKLEESGYVSIDKVKKIIRETVSENKERCVISKTPIYGNANCGTPLAYADDQIEGYLKTSNSIVPENDNLIALKAVGNSMNEARIGNKNNEKNIEDGDYVIVDVSQKTPADKDYILSIIDDGANIKRFFFDSKNNYVILRSESTEDIPDIIIDANDNYCVAGLVKYVVKKPQV